MSCAGAVPDVECIHAGRHAADRTPPAVGDVNLFPRRPNEPYQGRLARLVIKRDRDAASPLVFRVDYKVGDMYLKGCGRVKDAKGRAIALGKEPAKYVAGAIVN